MADLANLVLAIDSSQVKTGTAALDGLTAAGTRAEAATVGLSGGFKGASVQAAEMASAAQLSARSAMDQAAGFGAAEKSVRLNTMAMRESLVVARELSRGNFTRIPGSLTLLAQGIGSGGGLGAYAQALGLIKQVQNAELAEAAAATAASAAGVDAAARKAGASILAADTEIALAEAQLRVAETSGATAAAQTRLALANQAVAAASAEAAIAENALALAQGRATEASAAAKAAATTTLGTTGAVLIGVTIAALGTVGAFKALQATVDDSGALDRYAKSLVKTKDQLKDLEEKVGGFQVTWGDVFHGIGKAASDAIGSASIWDAFKEGNKNAFDGALHHAVDFAAKSYGVVRGSYQTIVDDWSKFPAIIGDAFYSAVNVAIGALNKLVKFGTDQINALIGSANRLPFVNLSTVSAPQIGAVGNPYAGAKLDSAGANISKFEAEARARINAGLGKIYDGIVGASDERIKDGLPKERKGRQRHPREHKEAADHADDTIARLDEQILSAKEKLAGGAVELANLQIQRIDVEKRKTIMDAAHKLADGKITKGEDDQINLQANVLAELKKQAVLREEATKLLTQQQAAQDQLFGFQTDALKFANDNATSQAAHRKIQLDMLDIAYQQKAFDLQILASKQKLAGDLAAEAVTQAQIANLPVAKSREQNAVEKATQDPLHAWMDSIHTDGPAIMEALQSIGTKGLDSLTSSLAGVVTGTESLGKAFKDVSRSIISDIIQMTIKMLIFRAISSILGGGLPGANSANTTNGWNMANAGQIPGFASGGSMIIGGNGGVDNNVMSINGQPKAMVGQGETLAVFPAGKAPNDNQRGPIDLKISFGSAPDFAPYVEQVVMEGVGQGIKISVDHTNQTIKALRRPGISGGR